MSESSTQARQVAWRAFASEFNAAGYTFKESDEERAPVYLLLPTGQRANRVFVVGTLTETEDVGTDGEYWRGRVVDPTGTFFIYAGQYQADAAATLQNLEPPAYIAIVGKPRTYEPEGDDEAEGDGGDGDEVYVSITPESISVVGGTIRDRWVAETAERTLARLEAFPDGGKYVEMAREQYDPDLEGFQQNVVSALESLTDDGDEEKENMSDGGDEPPAEPPSSR